MNVNVKNVMVVNLIYLLVKLIYKFIGMIKMTIRKIKEYTDKESCSYGIKGWYYSEPKSPTPEASFHRWL